MAGKDIKAEAALERTDEYPVPGKMSSTITKPTGKRHRDLWL